MEVSAPWNHQYYNSAFLDPRDVSLSSEDSRTSRNKVSIKRQLSDKENSRGRVAFGDITNSIHLRQDNDKASKGSKATVKAKGTSDVTVTSSSRSLLALLQPFVSASTKHDSKRGRHDWVDVDAQNKDDPQAVGEYAQAIFEYLRQSELRRRPHPEYLDNIQRDVNPRMRAILVDWLVEVSEEYGLCADTLYLAVHYMDRFLSLHVVSRNQLQLVGVACMWLAAKYEEIYPPNVSDFCYITDNTYGRDQVIAMEELILKTLSYELTIPTAKTFLRRLLQVCNPDESLHFLSNYLTELALLDAELTLRFLPSEVAAAGVYLSQLLLDRLPWDATLQHYSMYAPADLIDVVQHLATHHANAHTNAQLLAIRDKYGHTRFNCISRIQPMATPIAAYHFL